MKTQQKNKKTNLNKHTSHGKKRKWNLWGTAGLLVGILSIVVTFIVLPWWKNYDKPVLTYTTAIASIVRTNSIENGILAHEVIIRDGWHDCTVMRVNYSAPIENVTPPPESINVIIFLFFENTGNSFTEDIRAGVSISPFETADVTSSPNIGVTYKLLEAPTLDSSVVALEVPSLPPHSIGLVKVTAIYSAEFSKLAIFGQGPKISITGFSTKQTGQFSGEAKTLNAGDAFSMEMNLFNAPGILAANFEVNVIKAPVTTQHEVLEDQFDKNLILSTTCK